MGTATAAAAFAAPTMTATRPDQAADDAEDRALLARIAGGDRWALAELHRRHAPWLTLRLQRRCGQVDLVDTAVQDTFLAAWRSARAFRGEGAVAAWLWGIAARRLVDAQRRAGRVPEPVAEPALPAGADVGDASVEAVVVEARLSGRLAEALGVLDPDLRAVLLATALDGLTTAEAATHLGIPQGTVKTRLLRARRQLQERLR